MHTLFVRAFTNLFIFSLVCFLIGYLCKRWMDHIDKKMLIGISLDRRALQKTYDTLVEIKTWANGIGGLALLYVVCAWLVTP